MARTAHLAVAGLLAVGVGAAAAAEARPASPPIREVMFGRTTVLAPEIDGAVERIALYLDPEGAMLLGEADRFPWYPLDPSGDEICLDGLDICIAAELAGDGTLAFFDTEDGTAFPVVALFTGNLLETLRAPPPGAAANSDAALVAAVLAGAPLDHAAFGQAYPPTVTCHFPCLRGMTEEQRTGFLAYLRNLS
jgi:hypothetical protein